MDDIKKLDLRSLANFWGSSIVARCEIFRFTGGLISEKSLANLDSAGKGPKGRMRIGRKICYSTSSVIEWLENRAELV